MSILDILYTIFIGPLKYIFNFIYTISYYLTSNAGISIIMLSIGVNILMLPIHKKVDEIQKKEAETQAKLKPWVNRIKKAFKGDEQYMVLNTYYRQNNYKPIYSLKSSISLVIQIPFFIAAYSYIKELSVINGSSLFFIKDLSMPDSLLFGINVIPVLLTIVNVVSAIIFIKGQSFKENIQLFILPIVFLFLLYNAPSGLALYYLLNNIISLLRTVISKIRNKKIIAYFCSIISVVGIIYIVLNPLSSTLKEITALILLIALQVPTIYIEFFKGKIVLKEEKDFNSKNVIPFLLFLCFLYGLFIPSKVIASSPSEFVSSYELVNPIIYIVNAMLLSIGIFLIWIPIFYSLFNKNIKKILCYLLGCLCFISIINYSLFSNNLGTMDNLLKYDTQPSFDKKEYILNMIADILCIFIFLIVSNKRLFKIISLACVVAMMLISSINIVNINNEYERTVKTIDDSKQKDISIELSKSGNNVIILVIDRAISSYFPYLLNEDKTLLEIYKDFTYYPNTVSFGAHTKMASPALYGGYEYTPEELNKRSDEKMVDKHNEALMVMPVLFEENGYNVTVIDQQYGNYKIPSDLSFYENYENISAYNAEGVFALDGITYNSYLNYLNTLLFSYSITKSLPLVLHNITYNNGLYNDINFYLKFYTKNAHISYGIDEHFYASYAVLSELSNLSDIDDNNKNNLFILHNMTAHSAIMLLQEPEYVPAEYVNNENYDLEHTVRESIEGKQLTLQTTLQYQHYEANMAAIKKVGEYIEFLKENDVYDNTRIIIVSDHGHIIGQDQNMILDGEDLLFYNPLLLVKDFNSSNNQIYIDYTFMTNADVPTIATDSLIENPTNPFTGYRISDEIKKEGQLIIDFSHEQPDANDKTIILDSKYSISKNIFDLNNWINYSDD